MRKAEPFLLIATCSLLICEAVKFTGDYEENAEKIRVIKSELQVHAYRIVRR